mmetsp:Transcript_22003/g.40224  ORF Transcript_22003/g.40224 Transcript_22003/m.40224 type:complete len:376 (+) Transcript_22003:309-1436(+)
MYGSLRLSGLKSARSSPLVYLSALAYASLSPSSVNPLNGSWSVSLSMLSQLLTLTFPSIQLASVGSVQSKWKSSLNVGLRRMKCQNRPQAAWLTQNSGSLVAASGVANGLNLPGCTLKSTSHFQNSLSSPTVAPETLVKPVVSSSSKYCAVESSELSICTTPKLASSWYPNSYFSESPHASTEGLEHAQASNESVAESQSLGQRMSFPNSMVRHTVFAMSPIASYKAGLSGPPWLVSDAASLSENAQSFTPPRLMCSVAWYRVSTWERNAERELVLKMELSSVQPARFALDGRPQIEEKRSTYREGLALMESVTTPNPLCSGDSRFTGSGKLEKYLDVSTSLLALLSRGPSQSYPNTSLSEAMFATCPYFVLSMV